MLQVLFCFHINQLVILARIRNLEKIIIEKLENMPISYNVEKDSLYLRGLQKGRAEAAWKMFKAGNSIEIISTTLELTIEQVKAYIDKFEVN